MHFAAAPVYTVFGDGKTPLKPYQAAVKASAVTGALIEEFDPEAVVADILTVAAALITVVLAIRVGLALYTNWRLGEVEGRRARQFEALYEVGLAAAGERSVDELLKLVVEHATSLTRTDGAMLALAEWIAPRFSIDGFWTYVGATVVVWLVNWVLHGVFGLRDKSKSKSARLAF